MRDKNTFSPEEFQRQMMEFMKQNFGSAGGPPGATSAKRDEDPPADAKEDHARKVILEFNLKPRDVKAYLDRFVIKQNEAKKVLSVALCDHYHHVRKSLEGRPLSNYTKQNIILLGPTGVGKTYLVRSMAELVGVPFVKGDATKFSETGYVGGDVEDLVRELVRKADGDVERAQYGIIYIDEIDKIAAAQQGGGRDVSGRGVQTNLLKLMEETETSVRSNQDLAGQVQFLMDMQRGKRGPNVINTKHILFIVSGAFDGLEKIVKKRVKEAMIGFGARGSAETPEGALVQAQTRDFIDYGFEPEFIGRLPVRVVCEDLAVDDLFQILAKSEGSIMHQYRETFDAYGISALFKEDGLRRIAELAAEEKTGARGLMTVCERILRDFKFELPSTGVKEVIIDREMADHPKPSLERLMEASRDTLRGEGRQSIEKFAQEFESVHSLRIKFTEDAMARLMLLSEESGMEVGAVCRERFKDLHFGLDLIFKNTQRQEFVLGEEAVENPDGVLSAWVVESYRGEGKGQGGAESA